MNEKKSQVKPVEVELGVPESDMVPPSKTEWGIWLSAREKNALKVYTIKPEQLVADQRREQGISRDYKGREILELLQNAADAAKKAGERGRIRIELTHRGLIVANTGIGFTTGGVKSLQTADLSPKRARNSQLIGSKGLGFRSVLNWSRHPLIISGDLHLAFSSRYANHLVDRIINQHRNVRDELAALQAEGAAPAPLLPFPVDLSNPDNSDYVEDAVLYERCRELRNEGLDTVIGMPFDRARGYENALSQLELLRPEFLLFSDSIEALSVLVIAEKPEEGWEKQWLSEVVDEQTVVLTERQADSHTETCNRWKLFSTTGAIPIELLSDNDDPDSFHLVVALQEEGFADPGYLYSFFPTSIPLPLNLLCHASLALEQNRKHLQENQANEFVLERLASFVTTIVEREALNSGDLYRAIDLLARESLVETYPEDIVVFQDALLSELRLRSILPTLSGNLVSTGQALSFPSHVDDYRWLPSTVFANTIIARDYDDKCLFDVLGVVEIEGEQFIAMLRGASELTLEQRAAIILGIINEHLGSDFCYQGLLLDTLGSPLNEDDSIYLPGGSIGEGLVFPAWAKVKILNEQLWKFLRGDKVRDSVRELSQFGVQEYALGALIAGLVSAANAAVEQLGELEVRQELLSSLYKLYSLYNDPDERPVFPKRISAFVLNRPGEWVVANSVYIGRKYSSNGEIVECLYQAIPEKLLADVQAYCALGVAKDEAFGFLRWLGVEEWPREEQRKKIEPEFRNYVLQTLNYPVIFSESDSYQFDSFEGLPRNCSFRYVTSLDGIDSILESEDAAILAWLAKDTRVTNWIQVGSGHGVLKCLPSGCRNDRIYKGDLPSYIHWKIKSTPWLTSAAGGLLAPSESMINDAAVAGIFPRPVPPSKQTMEKYGLDTLLLRHAWLNSGVRSGVEDLDSEEIYALLTELPNRDPNGKLFRKLCNWLIKTVDFPLDETGKQYKTFLSDGKMFALQGEERGYFPVSESYHVDVEGFPQELLRSLSIASLPKKRGAEKVRRLFGVNVLDKEAVNEKVLWHSAAACTEQADIHFKAAKKYIEIYRHSHFSKAPGRSLFERLQLVVCDQVQVQVTFQQVTMENTLPPWTYSIQDDLLYVCCDPVKGNDIYSPLLANAIGDAIASIFGLSDGDPFSKIYQCDEASRGELLSKMLGDDLDEDLDVLLQALIEESTGQMPVVPIVTMGPVPDVPPPVEPSPNLTYPSEKPTPDVIDPGTVAGDWNVPSEIGVEPVEHVPEDPGTPVDIRVTGSGGTGGSENGDSSGNPPRKSDGTAGEELARLFEQAQGRFPMQIGHITGRETIAADLLSFRSEADREKFRSGKDQNAMLVERVIEAKEKWSGGRVKLTTNEVNTAAEWKDKYYIYRFTPIDAAASVYEMKALCNPLGQIEAVATSIEISLDTATTSEQFVLQGQDSDANE